MIFKKNRAILAAALSAAMMTNALLPLSASAAGSRTKAEAFGDDSYAGRFLSLYDDVITKGQENGYLSKNNVATGGFGIPYHSVETVIVEAPDYGHETTSEAMSYIVWMAAMRDNLAGKTAGATNTNDLTKAWRTMEKMIPTEQTGFWSKNSLSAQYADEEPSSPALYPTASDANNTGSNPIHSKFTSAYSGEKGEYLMHWLADVDNWYGYGSGTNFTFINTFQRGDQESCFETVPHPAIEELKYGNPQKGIKGIFNNDTNTAKQWAYTNAPDAEDRVIQAIMDANRWGVGTSELNTLAGKMGDELRNNMFDKYYKAIGCQNKNSGSTGYESAHYLMNWYTAWGGAMDGQWAWQIGCSHAHQFYQNPLAAYGLLYDTGLNAAMKAADATKDYQTSLQRQMEFYLWLQSATGPFAGGATNSWNGKYETYPSNVSTFYKMAYMEHPVYADPGSNGWIGNQVWSTQRLAELYYSIKTSGDKSNGAIKPGGLTLEEALKTMLDRWVGFFLEETKLTDDGDYSMPAVLQWSGQPATWNGTYSASANSGLTCTVSARGSSDLGCITSLANTLIHYAKANGVKLEDATATATTQPAKALYLAKELLDRSWALGRDNIGLSRPEHNGSLTRIFTQEVWIPNSYTGTMPNGDQLKNGVKFIDFRSKYLEEPVIQELKAAWEADGKPTYEQVAAGTKTGTGSVELNYHRFWHAGDILMALGTMAELYPDAVPGSGSVSGPLYGDCNVDGEVLITDLVLLNSVASMEAGYTLSAQGTLNADCAYDSKVDSSDAIALQKYLVKVFTYDKLGPQ